MAAEYDINLSNGNVLATLYPLETNGPDNRSTPRQVQDVRPQYPIILVVGAPGAGTISIVGDFTDVFRVGQEFEIVGSTGNDSTYTVDSVAFGGGNTQITTVENVTDNDADGDIIVHAFILNSDLAYRFISAFTFDVTLSGEVDGTYTVTALNSIVSGNTTIIPVTHGSIRDNLIASIALPYGQIQYTINDANTSLKLPGKSTLHYGEKIIENMVRMTEHFANDLAPELNTNIGSTPAGSPLKGQLWYKTLANEEGFLFHDGSVWSNQWDFDNGTLILRDPQNTTTPNSDIYLTGDETQLPAGYLGTDESGMVIWNEVDPVAQDAILRVMSVDGTENLRVEHDGYIRTANNLEVIGGGNGTVESYFHGKVGIGDNGLPTIERTLTIEGNGIAINADTGLNAGLILDCPSVTEQSIIEFEVADAPISRIHTETDARTVWESQGQITTDVTEIEIRGGNTTSGSAAGGIVLKGGTNDSGYGGNIEVTAGDTTDGDYAGHIKLTGGNNINGQYGGPIAITGGNNVDGQYAGRIDINGGESIGTAGGRYGGYVGLYGGKVSGSGEQLYGGDVGIEGGTVQGSGNNQYGGDVSIQGGTGFAPGSYSGIYGGDVSIKGGWKATGTTGDSGSVSIRSGNANDDPGAVVGEVSIGTGTSGDSTGVQTSGYINVRSGHDFNGAGTGNIFIDTGDVLGSTGAGASGYISIETGLGGSNGGAGAINLLPGPGHASSASDGANVNITSGDSGGTGATKGGDIVLTTTGNGIGVAADGIIDINGNTDIAGNVGINVAAPTGTVDLDVLGDIKTGTVFLGGDGAITAPTYSFTNDPNSGMFSAAADQLGFVTNGVNVFNVESDGTLSVNTASYETLILADNDIPNKKFVDDRIAEFDTLAELTDVTITTPAEDQVLTYSGGQWVNKTALPQYEEYSATGGEVIVNTTIPTVANTGSPGLATMQVFLNGIFQMEGAGKNYTVTGANQITFNVALVATDDVVMYSFNK